ncbi:hypothetical protein F5Y16DRAFT_395047 [Xylariaceae sp. FL0255]|nr:hypothetical protein F5Y16DRAFT_395047 [Xylariaceae sp. FL0255]
MASDLGATAGLIHLAFNQEDPSNTWLLGHLPTANTCINAVFTVQKGSLSLIELITSTLPHVSGAAMNRLAVGETWDQFADGGLGLKPQTVEYDNTISEYRRSSPLGPQMSSEKGI